MSQEYKFIGELTRSNPSGDQRTIFFNFRILYQAIDDKIEKFSYESKPEWWEPDDVSYGYGKQGTINIHYDYLGRRRLEACADKRICFLGFKEDKLQEYHRAGIAKKLEATDISIDPINDVSIYRTCKILDTEEKYDYPADLIERDFIDEKIVFCNDQYIWGFYTNKEYRGNQRRWIANDDGYISKGALKPALIGSKYVFWNAIEEVQRKDVLPINHLLVRVGRIDDVHEETLQQLKKHLAYATLSSKDSELNSKRIEKLERQIDNLTRLDDIQNAVQEQIQKSIDEQNPKILDALIELIEKNSTVRGELLKKSNIKSDREELIKLNKELEDKVRELTEQNSTPAVQTDSSLNVQQNIEELKAEKERLEGEVQDKKEKLGQVNLQIDSAKKKLDTQNDKLKEVKKALEARATTIAENVKSKINIKDIFEKKEDDYVLRAALEWNVNYKANLKRKEAESRAKDYCNIKYCKFDNEKSFINELYERVKHSGYYCNKIDIINLLICLKTSFLTFLAGNPGTGKTSLCDTIAKCMGLTNFATKESCRYVSVSVEKGWTSKRDLLGFYNSLTNETISNNKALLEAFYTMHYEAKSEVIFDKMPFIVLLDEANLSLMEYYWSDFMNVADDRSKGITFPDGSLCMIPEALKFIATINYDHTTETLSDRIIERSWIIKMFARDYNEIQSVEKSQVSESTDNYCMDWTIIKKNDNALQSFDAIYNLFKLDEETSGEKTLSMLGVVLSNRNKKMIAEYFKYAHLFEHIGSENEDDQINDIPDVEVIAQDYVIAQKILPLMSGWGTEYGQTLENLIKKWADDYPNSKKILQTMLERGQTDNRYSFFN